jgi:hypothetical protein
MIGESMTQLIQLHNEKKHFLMEFSNISTKALTEFASGNFEGIEMFYNKRETILEILRFIDEKISLVAQSAQQTPKPMETQRLEIAILEIKKLTQSIVSKDMDVLAIIEATKSAIIRELQSLKKNKKSVASYKTKVDNHQIDEQA